MNYLPLRICILISLLALAACASSPTELPTAVSGENKAPVLVDANGRYPTTALEKDEVVVKVIQSEVRNLQDFDSVEEGLKANLQAMIDFAKRACSTGKKPDFLLYNEFPLTGYSSGTRDEKLKFTIAIPGPETEALGCVIPPFITAVLSRRVKLHSVSLWV